MAGIYYDINMVLDIGSAAAALATSATNCVEFADKVTTIMVGCSNVLANSDKGHKVTNIYNS